MNKHIQNGGSITLPPFLILAFVIMFAAPHLCQAQAPDTLWTSYYNDGIENGNHGYNETCKRLIQTEDGGFLIGGRTYTPGPNRQRFPAYYIVKTDSDGVEEWTRSFDISRLHNIFYGLAQGENGQYYIAGTHTDTLTHANIIKIESNGDSLRSIDFDNSSFTNITNTTDGGILACGDVNTQLVKIDEDGNSIWQHTYDGGGDEVFLDVIETRYGGYVALAGSGLGRVSC